MRLSAISLASHYRIVVVGGGTGGLAVANRFRKEVPKGQIAVVEPSDIHYNQSAFTLVGGGILSLAECTRSTRKILHDDNIWVQKRVEKFMPKSDSLVLSDGSELKYDLLVIAMGLQLRYDMVDGLQENLNKPYICSIYHPDLVQKAYQDLRTFDGGKAVFTLPNTPIKCSGAGQKICYLADEIFKKRGMRDRVKLVYNTYLNEVFDVPKYTKALNEVIKQKSVELKVRRNLKRIDISKKEAVFEVLDNNAVATGELETQEFDFLHVAPPCSAPDVLRTTKELVNEKGFLDVNSKTLQSSKFDNIFGIGDCLGSPNKKTAAAAFSQMKALAVNIPAYIKGKPLTGEYNLYSSCPLVVSFNKVLLAEFTPNGPLETLPYDQGKPLYSAFLLKKYGLPFIYWNLGIPGNWNGPSTVRKLLRLGRSE